MTEYDDCGSRMQQQCARVNTNSIYCIIHKFVCVCVCVIQALIYVSPAQRK